MKTNLRVSLIDHQWKVTADNRAVNWLIQKLTTLIVEPQNRRGLNGILGDVGASYTKGRVVQVTAPPIYDPEQKADGGRVVRVMPKQLKKIKEAQEKAPSEL